MTLVLTPDQLADIRSGLLAARRELGAQVATLAESDQVLIAARASQEERAKSSGDADLMGVERNVVARQSEAVAGGLSELDAALARLDAGTYGTCVRCSNPIPVERLLARPRSAACVPCAAKR